MVFVFLFCVVVVGGGVVTGETWSFVDFSSQLQRGRRQQQLGNHISTTGRRQRASSKEGEAVNPQSLPSGVTLASKAPHLIDSRAFPNSTMH